MSSKKAKAARKNQTVTVTEYENFGIPLTGVKHIGKNIYVAFGLYDSEKIELSYVQNTEEYDFVSLEEIPVLIDNVKALHNLIDTNDDKEAKGLSLGIVLITDKSKLITDEAETFPFLVGAPRSWRNPKFGHLLDDDETEEEKTYRENIAKIYNDLFPMFDNVYKIEQIIDQAGMSNSLDRVLDKSLISLLTRN
jgi:hypothetical protein